MIGLALGWAVAVTVVTCRRKREAKEGRLRDRVGVSGGAWFGIDERRERRSTVCGSECSDCDKVGGILEDVWNAEGRISQNVGSAWKQRMAGLELRRIGAVLVVVRHPGEVSELRAKLDEGNYTGNSTSDRKIEVKELEEKDCTSKRQRGARAMRAT